MLNMNHPELCPFPRNNRKLVFVHTEVSAVHEATRLFYCSEKFHGKARREAGQVRRGLEGSIINQSMAKLKT